jgi:predicted nucleic acid-binding protein
MRTVVAARRTKVSELEERLDPGEAEAIVVAVELSADLILMDEHDGRRTAIAMGLRPMGLLGVLAEAKRRHLIHACRPLMERMLVEANFWIGKELQMQFLRSVDEAD